MISIDMKRVRKYSLVALAYLMFSVLLFYPMILNITSSVPGSGGDVYQGMWDIWWVPYSMFVLHSSPYFSSYVFYPVGANLATQTFAPIAGLVSAVFQPIGVAFAYNIIFLIGFVLSGLFAYLLAHHITKNDIASFIAGFIFAFSPIHVIQSFGHLQFINIEFMPLFLLFFLKMIEEKKPRYAALAAVSFVLTTFMGDIEQGLMTVLLAFFVLIYFAAEPTHRKNVFDRKFAILLVELAAAILVIGSPFFIGVAGGLTSTTLSDVNAQANAAYNTLYSPDFFSFMIPSSLNGLLAPVSNAFSSINAPAASERTTYAGFTVLLLAAVAVIGDYKDKFKHTGMLLVPLVLFALLSIGPVLQFGGHVTGIPGIYQIYRQIPFFNVLREPGRFDLMIELLLGILAAIGFAKLEGKYLNTASAKRYAPVLIMILLLLEFNAWPTSQAMTSGMYANAVIPKAYSEIGSLSGNFSVLMLPSLPDPTSGTPALYPGLALYYQTAFKHPLVGGYTTRVNTTQTLSLVNMPLVAATYYLQTGQGLVYGSPIVDNYTHGTEFLFGAYNIGFVSVMDQAFNTSELQQLSSYLTSVFGAPVYNNLTQNTMIFGTTGITNASGSSLVSYTPVLFNSVYSIWQPGWVFCTTSQLFCNATNSNKWFSVNPAYINIYSPAMTHVNVTIKGAYSPSGLMQELVYLNNRQQGVLNLTNIPSNFTFRLILNAGVSQLVFYSRDNLTGYSNIALNNITISNS